MYMRRPPLIHIDLPALRPGTFGAYAFALVCAGAAMALRLVIDPYVASIQYVTFFPAVMIAALISGLGAGIFCLALSVVATIFFMMEPRFSFQTEDPRDMLTTLLFILVTLTNVILIAGMRHAIEAHEALGRKLEQQESIQERLAEEVARLQQGTKH
jgi:K+-sensing histidine kinase KdpD